MMHRKIPKELSKNFLDPDVQEWLWGARWGFGKENLLPYVPGESITPFLDYLTSTSIKLESRRFQYEDRFINWCLFWEIPKGRSSMTVELERVSFTVPSAGNPARGGILMSAPPSSKLTAVLDDSRLPIEASSFEIDSDGLDPAAPWKHVFVLERVSSSDTSLTKSKYPYIDGFSIESWPGWDGQTGVGHHSRQSDDHVDSGWTALDAEKVDDFTLKVYTSGPVELGKPNFNDLVFLMRFDSPLKDCNVGFVDMPGFFS